MVTKALATKKASAQTETITLPALKIQVLKLRLVGDSPLICHAWSEKAKAQIRDKHLHEAAQAKGPRVPEQEFLDSLYHLPGGNYGFPSTAFKSAAVDACSHVSGVTKVLARGAFHIVGEFVRIEGEPVMREDMVRIAGTTASLAYRGTFPEWRADLTIRYNVNVMSAAQVINLFNTAGFAVGVGDWRPERNGVMGLFHVESGVDAAKAAE